MAQLARRRRGELSAADYGTELPGARAIPWQLSLARHRYGVLASYAPGRTVLDAACGAGQGLPLLRATARTVVAGDLILSNLDLARLAAPGVPVVEMSAEAMPFPDTRFDVVALLEAIYYLADAGRFVREAWRVLRPGGTLLVSSVNPMGRDYGRPPRNSTQPLDSRQLGELIGEAGFDVELFGAFRPSSHWSARYISTLRAVSANLRVPWPTSARWLIRRVLHGPVQRFSAVMDEADCSEAPMVKTDPLMVDRIHRVLYAIGTKRDRDATSDTLPDARGATR